MLPKIEVDPKRQEVKQVEIPKKDEVTVNENSLRVNFSETGPGSDNVE